MSLYVCTDRPNMKLIIVLSFLTAVLAAQSANKDNELNMKNYFDNTHLNVHPVPRIRNGQEAVPHSIPHQVLLTHFDKFNETWNCGGILISSKYVLSAAACVERAVAVQVLLGAHNISQREETQVTISTKSIKMHENFNFTQFLNDIAVYELETEAQFNVNIQPAKLPSKKDVNKNYAGQIGRVSGWGGNDMYEIETPVLNYALEPIITNAQCSVELEIVDSVIHLQDSNLCLEGKHMKSTCLGDYGGPLSVDEVVVGIVSYGTIYCFLSFPSVFTKITSFLDWIEENTDVVIQ